MLQVQVHAPLPWDDLRAHAVPGVGHLQLALGDAVAYNEARAEGAEGEIGRAGQEVDVGGGDREAGTEEGRKAVGGREVDGTGGCGGGVELDGAVAAAEPAAVGGGDLAGECRAGGDSGVEEGEELGGDGRGRDVGYPHRGRAARRGSRRRRHSRRHSGGGQ